MRVALYGRISTLDKGQDHENQFRELRQYCEKMNYEIHFEFVDIQSGACSRKERKNLDAMFLEARKKKFDLLLFWSLDRLTREGSLATLNYLNELKQYRVKFHSYTEPFASTADPINEGVTALLAGIAKQEKNRISERTKAGMARAKEKGASIGRPRIDQEKRKKIIQTYIKSLEESKQNEIPVIGARKLSRMFSVSVPTASIVLREYREGKLDKLGNFCIPLL